MADWLAVAGTLAGAIIAGGISSFAQWLSNRHNQKIAAMSLAEERARWAAERQLDRIHKFYGTIEKLIDAVVQFRIQQAWEALAEKQENAEKPPKRILSYNEARGDLERALQLTRSEIALLDQDMELKYETAIEAYSSWFLSMSMDEFVENLVRLEGDIRNFKLLIAEEHRRIFIARRIGSDISTEIP